MYLESILNEEHSIFPCSICKRPRRKKNLQFFGKNWRECKFCQAIEGGKVLYGYARNWVRTK